MKILKKLLILGLNQLLYADFFLKKLETIQIVNREKHYNGPLRTVILLIKNPLFLDTIQSWTNEDWLASLRDFNLFTTNIIYHLSMDPLIVNMVSKSVSNKILVHHSKSSIVGICVIAISPDGTYLSKIIIPNSSYKNTDFKNIIFIIENNNIKVFNGVITVS